MQELSDNKVDETRRLTCILAADIAKYSALAESNEALAIKAVQVVHEVLSAIVGEYGGRIFNRAGDGFLAEFQSADNAILSSLKFAEAIQSDKRLKQGDNGIAVRIGVHVGDVVEQTSGDLLGHGVNVAARLQQEAGDNGILASANIVNLLSSTTKQHASSRRTISMKNIDQSIDVFEIVSTSNPGSQKIRSRLRYAVVCTTVIGIAVAGFALSGSGVSGTTTSELAETTTRQIDRRAIRAAMAPLSEFKRPNDAAISALIETNDFFEAIELLEFEYLTGLNSDPQTKKINLLHQIGALAFDRDQNTALRVYRQIHKANRSDHLATLQLARIYNSRSEKSEAESIIVEAMNEFEVSKVERWKFEIELARIQAPPFNVSRERLKAVADEAMAFGNQPISLDARSYAIAHDWVHQHFEDSYSAKSLSLLLEEINSIIPIQKRLGLDHQLSRSYILRGIVQQDLELLSEAIDSQLLALEIETVLERPALQVQTLTNIASAYLNKGDFQLADEYNARALSLSIEHDLVSTLHTNQALKAKITFAKGDSATACIQISEALQALPAGYPSRELLTMKDEFVC